MKYYNNRTNRGRFQSQTALKIRVFMVLLVLFGLYVLFSEAIKQVTSYISFTHSNGIVQAKVSSTAIVDSKDRIESAIYETWGRDKYSQARAIAKCESGLRESAINWATHDVGLFQINMSTWEAKIKEKFDMSVSDLLRADNNIMVAYWIWDRGNKVEGDGAGSWGPWVVWGSKCFLSELDK